MRFNQHPLLINTLLGEQNNPLFFFFLFSLVDMASLNEIRFNLHPLLINIRGYLREFVNYRHPCPRRVWMGGSEPHLMTPFPVDPLDPLDPVDPVAAGREFQNG